MKRISMITAFLFPVVLTINLWMLSKENVNTVFAHPFRSLGQITGLVGVVLLSFSLVLTTRLRKIESLFGGLDTVYGMHHTIGALSFMLLINHPLFFVLSSLPNMQTASVYLIPGSDISLTIGILGIYTMIVSFVFMVFVRLPFHIWKQTHRFLGVAFLLGAAHSLLVVSDISAYVPLRMWISIVLGIGFASVVYTLFFYQYFGPKYTYEVLSTVRQADILHIVLKPVTQKTLRFQPGQFIYIRFNNDQVGTEPHPFSLSSAPFEQTLRVSVKILGDYTVRLPLLEKGDRAYVFGPYGSFGGVGKKEKSIWIGGGIGVTPFLSMIRHEAYESRFESISMYYCYRKPEEGIFCSELEQSFRQTEHADFIRWCTKDNSRLTAHTILSGKNIDDIDSVLCCGPKPMMESLKSQFVDLGLSEHKFRYEDFNTGI